jgi:acetyl esterase/lipase
MVGQAAMEAERGLANDWRAAGWETVSITYRGCNRSVGDVVKFYDLVRAHFGPDVPICLMGQSAGGHLALMVAARRWDVSCVISQAGPSDLRKPAQQGKAEAQAGTGPKALAAGSAWGAGIAKSVFGAKNLKAASPVLRAAHIYARLLLASADDDVVVPNVQDQNMAAAMARARPGAYVDVDVLAPGPTAFIHGTASVDALKEYQRRVAAVVSPFGKSPFDPKPPPVVSYPWPFTGFASFLRGFTHN